MVLELSIEAWSNEIEEKGKALHLTEVEIKKIRQALSVRLLFSKQNPIIEAQEFDDLIDKVMCVRFNNGKNFVLSCRKGYLSLSSED